MTLARRKVDECVRRMERSDAQVDELVAKLDRRTRLFDEERKAWYKEFLTLKELLRRAGIMDDMMMKTLEGAMRWSCFCMSGGVSAASAACATCCFCRSRCAFLVCGSRSVSASVLPVQCVDCVTHATVQVLLRAWRRVCPRLA